VQVAQRWIVAALRHHKFFSLEELNVAIRELLTKLNNRPFRKRDGSRASVFAAIDKPALKPLPAEPFDLSEWSRARVNIDYNISFDANLYSVPYNLVHELVEICEDRYQTRSTILTSQLPVARWHEQIGDPTAADGILDRLVHNAHRIEMRGDSMRKKRGPQPSS
jgi:hypothetical protein